MGIWNCYYKRVVMFLSQSLHNVVLTNRILGHVLTY